MPTLRRTGRHYLIGANKTDLQLGNSPRTILEEFARIHSTDIVLPTASTPLRLRCVVRPDREQAALFDSLGLCLPEGLKSPSTPQ